MVRVKICGITSSGDARLAIEAGAHALGLIFVSASPRCIDVASAARITSELPPLVYRVGVFEGRDPEVIGRAAEACELHAVQLVGYPDVCPAEPLRRRGLKVMLALRIKGRESLAPLDPRSPDHYDADAYLIDSYKEGALGGTGETFDWDLAVEAKTMLPASRKLILAGGLTPDNVAAAVRKVEPYAVDVSSGVEAHTGIKDPDKLRAFFSALYEERWRSVQLV